MEGQLAVARVVMNRAESGRYPPDWCSVVKQPGSSPSSAMASFRWSYIDPPPGPALKVLPPRDCEHGPERQRGRALVSRELRRAVLGPPPEPRQKIGTHIFYRA